MELAYTGKGGPGGNDFSLVFNEVELRYRKMVCGVGVMDWLCAAPGPQWLHKDWPVYFTDHATGRSWVYAEVTK